MTRRYGQAISLVICLLASAWLASPVSAQTMWRNGRWFDGTRFVSRTMYSTEAGLLSSRRPRSVRTVIDLENGYVVPAYGDAHHHGIDGETGLDAKIAAFLRDGIFYVKNPNVVPDLLTPDSRRKINRPDSIDVAFANGGLTSTGGHPGPLHDHLADRGVFPGLTRQEMPSRGYFNIDDEQVLAAAWPKILAGRPDFIKVFLNGREHLTSSSVHQGKKAGLRPEVLGAVVRRARRAGLRVTAHIDTAADFVVAVHSGVNELAHAPLPEPGLPGGYEPYVIPFAAAAAAATRGVTVVATASVVPRLHGAHWTAAERAAVAAVHKRNLQVMKQWSVRLAVGSDGISGEVPFATARSEIEYLRGHGMLDGLALLRMWAVNTPRTIFPDRKIGDLRSGYEANFLVLGGDPISDAANLHRIWMKVKSGKVLPQR